MMVDPLFMIIQNLRSFLTAVTPTAVTTAAVAPIANQNLPEFTWIYMNFSKFSWIYLNLSEFT